MAEHGKAAADKTAIQDLAGGKCVSFNAELCSQSSVARMYIRMYSCGMPKQYSIADARRNLPTVVDEVESGAEVQLTRRGRAVAVVVSIEEYERLKANRMTFAEAYDAFRKKFPASRDGISSRYFRSVRERGRGREVDL